VIYRSRVVARRFNARYAAGAAVFPEPTALINDQQLILGVDRQKMSKSRGNMIRLAATEDETASLIRKARTDSEPTITYEPERRPPRPSTRAFARTEIDVGASQRTALNCSRSCVPATRRPRELPTRRSLRFVR
jgi:tryptophanyl-tRNA synthetase